MSPEGSDSNSGTRAEPFATVQAAIETADAQGNGGAPWSRVAELFDAVVDLGPEEREARIRETAGADRTLGREVRELVRASRLAGEGGFLTQAVASAAREFPLDRER